MRKALLVGVVMFGLAVSADAKRQNLMPKPIQEVTAKTMVSSNGSTTLLKGDVRITMPGAVIYADEATVDAATSQVDLRGNVHMTLSPVPPPLSR